MMFVDPYGQPMRVLHLFRRNPAVSITLQVSSSPFPHLSRLDIHPTIRFYSHGFDLRIVTNADELQEVHLPLTSKPVVTDIAPVLAADGKGGATKAIPATTREVVVLAGGATHNTTVLVLEESSGESSSPSSSTDNNNSNSNSNSNNNNDNDNDDDDDEHAKPLLGITVSNLASTYAKLQALGAEVSPFDPAVHHSFTCLDPEGNIVQVSSHHHHH